MIAFHYPLDQGGVSRVRHIQPLAGTGDAHVGEVLRHLGRPLSHLRRIQPQQEHAGVVQALGALDGGDGHAVGGDVVAFFGLVVLGDPVGEDAFLFEGVADELRQGLLHVFVGLLDGVEDGDLGEGQALVGQRFDPGGHVVDDGFRAGELFQLGLGAVIVEVVGE